MNYADQMFRLTKDITKQDENKTRDEVDMRPEIFFTGLRTLNANETEVLFNAPELPVKFVPRQELTTTGGMEAAKQISRLQNSLLAYSMTADNREEKMRANHFFANKYGNAIAEMCWFTQKKKTKRRVAKLNPDKTPVVARDGTISTTVETVEEIIEHPMYRSYDMKDVRFDAQIENFQDQQCILIRIHPLMSQLLDGQAQGYYKNVSRAGLRHLYIGEGTSDVKSNRQANADEASGTEEKTGAFEARYIWIRAPINDEGEWDEEGTQPTWHWVEVLGDLEGATFTDDTGKNKESGLVCIRLNPNPYDDGEHPFQLFHSHRDDKGALHMGYVDFLWSLWNEYKTALDQWYDAKNLMNAAPWITERGAMHTGDMTFGPRRLLIMNTGKFNMLKRVEHNIYTQDMLQFLNNIERRFKDAIGITDPFEGIPMGGRTSASEAKSAFEQVLRPFIEKLRYMGEPHLVWMALKDANRWRQFARPDTVIRITEGNSIVDITPLQLFGPLYCDVQVIEEYQRNMLARMEQDRLFSMVLPAIMKTNGKKVVNRFIKALLKSRKTGLDEEEIFEADQETDAQRAAESENLGFLQGILDDPKPGEDDEVHMRVHKNGLRMYALLPNIPEEAKRLLQEHILRTEEKMQADQNEMASAAQGPGLGPEQQIQPGMPTGGEPVPLTEGQVLEAEQGAEATPEGMIA
jgi:hypothetical protein